MIEDYLIHSYLYYKLNESIISDTEYDALCKNLLADWDNISNKYKHLVSPGDLLAGTGYSIAEYPEEIIKKAELRLLKHNKKDTRAEYRTVTYDSEELYNDLRDASNWFLKGLRIDYNHFLNKEDGHRDMALGVIDKILKEREDGI